MNNELKKWLSFTNKMLNDNEIELFERFFKFQEIIKNDFIVKTIKLENKNYIKELNPVTGKFYNTDGTEDIYGLSFSRAIEKGWIINSVLKVSTNEIFNLNEKISSEDNIGIIRAFNYNVNDKSMWVNITWDTDKYDKGVVFDEEDNHDFKNGCVLDYLSKLKPLFTTFDKVDIYKGDKFYLITTNFSGKYMEPTLCTNEFYDLNFPNLAFHNEQLAKDYKTLFNYLGDDFDPNMILDKI